MHLEVIQIITAILAIIALTSAAYLGITHANDLQTSRTNAANDSCHLLRGLVYAATYKAPQQRAAADAYIAHTPLRDCRVYAREVVR
jgi:hypothetical protein